MSETPNPEAALQEAIAAMSGAPPAVWSEETSRALSAAVLDFLKSTDDEARRRVVLGLLDRLVALVPANAVLQTLRSATLRVLGQFPEAIAAAEQALALEPGLRALVSLEGALKAAGQLDRATDVCRQAIAASTDEARTLALHLDLGDLLLERGLLEESLVAYRQLLAKEPKHPWAFPSACYIRVRLDDDETFLDKLAEFAQKRPDTPRARVLLQKLMQERRDWETHIPLRHDVLVDALSTNMDELVKKKSRKLALGLQSSYPSAASMSLVPALLEGRFDRVDVRFLEPENDADPDPRVPRGDVPFLLWRYEGHVPVRAVSAPDPAVASEVAALAATPFEVDSWWSRAGALAHTLGVASLDRSIGASLDRSIGASLDRSIGASLESLLAAMVYPGPPPPKIQPWNWIFRLQVAAAFTIAQLDSGWEHAARRRALVSLALGPLDWTNEAALVAMTEIARREPEYKEGVLEVLEQLLDDGQPEGEPLAFLTLLICLQRIPDLPVELAVNAREALTGLLQ